MLKKKLNKKKENIKEKIDMMTGTQIIDMMIDILEVEEMMIIEEMIDINKEIIEMIEE